MRLSGWGRYPVIDCPTAAPEDEASARAALGDGPKIARGAGRGYGDCALQENGVIETKRLNRMVAFDAETGDLICESGVRLAEILEVFVPRGFFPPVTPGTKFVTVGGMIAADVHGKNHHLAGSFGDHVQWLDLLTADGAVLRCSSQENADLFNATIGGMGLTGVILRAAFRLIKIETAYIRQELIPAPNLDAVMAAFERTTEWTYSVAWIDCLKRGNGLGRSLLMLGEHATLDELPDKWRAEPLKIKDRGKKSVPFDFPRMALNSLSVRAFNEAYYRNGKRKAGVSILDWDSYFYPLDAILDWNRIYGARGFTQYQCVLPPEESAVGMRRLIQEIADSGAGSFLAVLKLFGPGSNRPLSFPTPGYTLALDFPISDKVLALLDRLDVITEEHGGRLYLAKDARARPDTFKRGYGAAVPAFAALRRTSGADEAFASAQSERLSL